MRESNRVITYETTSPKGRRIRAIPVGLWVDSKTQAKGIFKITKALLKEAFDLLI